jgi:hypothetical protein
MRFSRILWPFPFLVRVGWLSTRVPNPPAESARGRVFLLRGNGIIFSPGFAALCAALRRAGWWAEDLRCVGDRWACRRLVADHKAGRLRGPVVFVGHSCGGRYSLYGAEELLAAGVGVDLVVCLDVAGAPPVPGNVRRAVHLYRSRRRLYPARSLVPALGSAARVDNVDLDAPGSPVDPRWLVHVTVPARAAVRAFVLRCVEEAAGG